MQKKCQQLLKQHGRMRSVRSRTPGNKRNCQQGNRISILVNNQVSAINISLGMIKSIRSETHFFRKNGISEVPFYPNKHALQSTLCLLTTSDYFYHVGHKQVLALRIQAYLVGITVLLKVPPQLEWILCKGFNFICLQKWTSICRNINFYYEECNGQIIAQGLEYFP